MPDKPLDTNEMVETSEDFENAYRVNAPYIYRFVFWRTKDEMLAQDLTSRVFEKAWRSRSSFRGGSVRAWLHRIARNTLVDHWRKKKEITCLSVENIQSESYEPNINEMIDKQILLGRLQKAISKLPKDMQAIIRLRFIEGFSSKEVAIKLQLTETNVRVMQYRALRKLRGYLK